MKLEQEVHIFGSGLGAERAEKSKEEIANIIKDLDDKSDFSFCVVTDIEEVKRGNTVEDVLKNKVEARNRASQLISVLGDYEGYEKYKGLIIRVNPIESEEYEKDIEYFKSLSDKQKQKIRGVYVPDFEEAEAIGKVSKDLGIEVHKIMPIIETSEGHDNLTEIAEALINGSKGEQVYIIGTGDAYHRFLYRAESNGFMEEQYIDLTPDTSLGDDKASRLAHQETVRQIIKLNKINTQSNLNVMLATSTLIDKEQNPGDITALALDTYNNPDNFYHTDKEGWKMQGHIGKVTIHPSQMTISKQYRKDKKISDITPLSHRHSSEEVVNTYLRNKSINQSPIIRGYVILDAQFYIALFKEFKKYGVKGTVKRYKLLNPYMGKDSSLLLESIFDEFKEDIIFYPN